MPIRQLKTTAATPILYHLTNVFKAANILTKNRFELKPSEGTQVEQSLSKDNYYLSTTRSRLGSYTVNGIYHGSVIFVLDGDKLAANHRIVPVDYWQTKPDSSNMTMYTDSDEAEDRVLSKSPFIENAYKYIKEVHVALVEEKSQLLFTIKKSCLLHKIPVYFYENYKSLLTLDKRKAVPIDAKPDLQVKPPSEYDYKYRLRKNSITPWLQLYYFPLKATDSNSKYKVVQSYKEKYPDFYRRYQNLAYADAVTQLDSDIHNAKSIPYEHVSKEREALDKLVGLLRKNKWTTKEFIRLLHDKWYSSASTVITYAGCEH